LSESPVESSSQRFGAAVFGSSCLPSASPRIITWSPAETFASRKGPTKFNIHPPSSLHASLTDYTKPGARDRTAGALRHANEPDRVQRAIHPCLNKILGLCSKHDPVSPSKAMPSMCRSCPRGPPRENAGCSSFVRIREDHPAMGLYPNYKSIRKTTYLSPTGTRLRKRLERLQRFRRANATFLQIE